MFIMMSVDSDEKEQEIKKATDETKDKMNKAFAGKTRVSEQEFYQLCTENQDTQELDEMLRGIVSMSLLCQMTLFFNH
jgi:hypothetical protein